jgi:DNA-binding NarL/FixJ family response regulator
MIKIILADDHHVVRQGLRSLLEAESDFEIIGEAAGGLETIQLVEQMEPDILVLDLVMPDLSGLEVVRQVGQRSPKTLVIILSMHANEAYVLEALRNGASGYVLKKATAGELVEAVHVVISGRRYLSPPLSEHAIQAYIQKADERIEDSYELLTDREREVLHLAAKGLTGPEIANLLSISPRTVEMHRANMMHKLELRNQLDMFRYAVRKGILTIDELDG